MSRVLPVALVLLCACGGSKPQIKSTFFALKVTEEGTPLLVQEAAPLDGRMYVAVDVTPRPPPCVLNNTCGGALTFVQIVCQPAECNPPSMIPEGMPPDPAMKKTRALDAKVYSFIPGVDGGDVTLMIRATPAEGVLPAAPAAQPVQ